MARQTFRANLGSAEFPLLSDYYGRTVVVGKQDMHYIRPNAFSGSEADKNIGIPQVIFCENVMPFSNGYQSISYTIPITAGSFTDADRGMYLRDAAEKKTLFVPAAGACRTFNANTGVWATDPKTVPAGAVCSIANLKGRTFIVFAGGTNFYEWNGTTLPIVAITGLTPANLLGVTSANSYLVAWDSDTIYWSSTITPTDFVPSLSSGAGSEKILGLKGKIVYCKAIPDGFIIYATGGSHIARYSNNIRYPWVFSEITGSSGVSGPEQIADDPNGVKIYVFNNDGVVEYDRVKATQVFPAVSEFLAIRIMEQYNSTTKTVEIVPYFNKPQVKVAFVGSRFLVISYGIASLTHALIYDSVMQRWGKVRIDHVDCFEFFGGGGAAGSFLGVAWSDVPTTWNAQGVAWSSFGPVLAAGSSDTAEPYKSIGFLQASGQVKVVDFAHTNTDDTAVLYIGRFQFIRDRLITVLDVEAEGMGELAKDTLAILTSIDGTNFDKTTYPMLVYSKKKSRRWQCRLTGINHILRHEGNFQLTTVQLRSMLNGSR